MLDFSGVSCLEVIFRILEALIYFTLLRRSPGDRISNINLNPGVNNFFFHPWRKEKNKRYYLLAETTTKN